MTRIYKYSNIQYLHGGLVLEGAEGVVVHHTVIGVRGGVDLQVPRGGQEKAVDHPEHHEDHQTRCLLGIVVGSIQLKSVILNNYKLTVQL